MTVIAENMGLIHTAVKKVWPRACLIEGMEYDELFQEGCNCFLYAETKHNPEGKMKLSSYVMLAMVRHLNRIVDEAAQKRMFQSPTQLHSGDEDYDLLDSYEVDCETTPLRLVELESTYQHHRRSVSPLAQRMMHLLVHDDTSLEKLLRRYINRQNAHYPRLDSIIALLHERGIPMVQLKSAKKELLALREVA